MRVINIKKSKKNTSKNKKKELRKNEIILIGIILIAGYLIIHNFNSNKEIKIEQLKKEAELLTTKVVVSNSELGIAADNEIDDHKLSSLADKNYYEIKNALKIKNDFCIFFEDQQGNLVRVDGLKAGIGSGKIIVNGDPCGK